MQVPQGQPSASWDYSQCYTLLLVIQCHSWQRPPPLLRHSPPFISKVTTSPSPQEWGCGRQAARQAQESVNMPLFDSLEFHSNLTTLADLSKPE